MNKILFAATLATVLVSTVAHADFSDPYSCTKDDITDELSTLVASSAGGTMYGIRLIYVKAASEVSRKPDELRCRVVAVTSQGTVTGIFNFKTQDGHSLVGFQPGKTR